METQENIAIDDTQPSLYNLFELANKRDLNSNYLNTQHP